MLLSGGRAEMTVQMIDLLEGYSEFAFGTIKHPSSFTLLSKRLFSQNMNLQSKKPDFDTVPIVF